jgi:hypothetical protein
MKRSPLDALVTENSLRIVSGRFGDPERTDDEFDGHAIKNVCAKVPGQLADEIEEIVDLLGISKRSFLEAAFREAVLKAKAIMEEEGAWTLAYGRKNFGGLKSNI